MKIFNLLFVVVNFSSSNMCTRRAFPQSFNWLTSRNISRITYVYKLQDIQEIVRASESSSWKIREEGVHKLKTRINEERGFNTRERRIVLHLFENLLNDNHAKILGTVSVLTCSVFLFRTFEKKIDFYVYPVFHVGRLSLKIEALKSEFTLPIIQRFL